MDWTRGHTIGRGATAAVSTAASHPSGDIFAVKSGELSKSESLQREQKFLSSLNCPHIIGYKGRDITVENGRCIFNLMMEYASGGTLVDAIHRSGGQMNESTVSYYARQILKGLEYLHRRGIVHCDIKGSNILLTQSGAVKIADFGCAKAADEAAIGGTPMYMAPEVARGEAQGFSADIWALGSTFIEMSTGNSPWPNAPSTLHRIAFSGELPKFPPFLSDLAKDFLSKCLRVDPKERWTAKQLLEHPFLDEFRFPQLKQVQELLIRDNTDSPTSILDQGIWSSTGEDISQVINDLKRTDSLNSPKQRIDELSLNSGMANWEWEERWTTVRDIKNNVKFLHGDVSFNSRCIEQSRNHNLEKHIDELVSDQFQLL
ncbi:hypothetical protein BUALT_Bualt03G0210400 [Buddleja alternifolia]|uniref:Protein kinase domain-containing protein n=1 Tax=Buddleja alternifolia TaxID=168488 RepID=A0AAV6Y230_9LAMI|nr:hypothetical protein BUALT_Bualt03G0210400 [Buddleja alternifolia]